MKRVEFVFGKGEATVEALQVALSSAPDGAVVKAVVRFNGEVHKLTWSDNGPEV